MGILTAQQHAELNRAGTSGMGHLRVMRTTDASYKTESYCGRMPAKFRQVAGFGVGSGIAPVTTVSEEASSSTGGR